MSRCSHRDKSRSYHKSHHKSHHRSDSSSFSDSDSDCSNQSKQIKEMTAELAKCQEKIVELTTRMETLEKDNEEIQQALNETREQVQALLDYCFTDRSKWKEGMINSVGTKLDPIHSEEGQLCPNSVETKMDPNHSEEGQCNIHSSDMISETTPKDVTDL